MSKPEKDVLPPRAISRIMARTIQAPTPSPSAFVLRPEAPPELAGRCARFLALAVWFEDEVPIEASQVEGSLITFDDDGHRELVKASGERRTAAGLLDQSHRPATSEVISAGGVRSGRGHAPSRAPISVRFLGEPRASLRLSYRVISAYDYEPRTDDGQPFAPIVRPAWFHAFEICSHVERP